MLSVVQTTVPTTKPAKVIPALAEDSPENGPMDHPGSDPVDSLKDVPAHTTNAPRVYGNSVHAPTADAAASPAYTARLIDIWHHPGEEIANAPGCFAALVTAGTLVTNRDGQSDVLLVRPRLAVACCPANDRGPGGAMRTRRISTTAS